MDCRLCIDTGFCTVFFDIPPPLKKAKRQPTSQPYRMKIRSRQCHLLREILAEILSNTRPPESLSLARTSKYFCRILCDPGSSLMWKRARIAPDFQFVIPARAKQR